MEYIRKKLFIVILIIGGFHLQAQSYYNFENDDDLQNWNINKGTLSITSVKQKLGKKSLHIKGQPGTIITIEQARGLSKASRSNQGGITTWIYNDNPIKQYLIFSFTDQEGKEICRLPFSLHFKGWRCLWAQFTEDMDKEKGEIISKVNILFPEDKQIGNIYLDYLEFTPKVPWQKMSDAQYCVNRTDFSLIPDFLNYRNTSPYVPTTIKANKEDIATIEQRLTDWYLGSSETLQHPWIENRRLKEQEFIKTGVTAGKEICIAYDTQQTPIGKPLYPMAFPTYIDKEDITKFRDINEKILLPLALDYKINGDTKSLKKALYIYDYFYDQGWADGSGLGTLCFEKLRSSGYFHSFYLLKDKLNKKQLERELNTLQWFTLFGICYQEPEHTGEVADNLRALALPKLIYALSLTDSKKREIAMTAFRNYMNNALSIAPGFFGTIKADFSGYHHRGPYFSAYYPHALYAGALVTYLLHDTPYALSEKTMNNLKQALLAFRFFCANLDCPAGTVGRFPNNQQILETLLPAFAYVALSYPTPDRNLIAAFKKITEDATNKQAIDTYINTVNSNLTYTSSIGEAELMAKLSTMNIASEETPTGALFMPYSGLMVIKNSDFHFNMKGFSKYVWDFESSSSENLKGRYLSYGQIEYFDFKNGHRSFNPREKAFNWNHIPGTTVKVLPDSLLTDKGGASSGHRNFSDETFLAGIKGGRNNALFSFRMHDITYDKSLRANKSVFVFDDVLLCLGSDIACNDLNHPVATTLFQAIMPVRKFKKQEKILNDSTLLYAVQKGNIKIMQNTPFTTAYLDHSTNPVSDSYLYYILPLKEKRRAQELLSERSPIRIIKQNNDAHIVIHQEKRTIFAALFNPQETYENLLVKQVNIPLAYILEENTEKNLTLSICEPDMRRTSHEHMGLLTEKDVIEQEKPFNTTLILKGVYTAYCPGKNVVVLPDTKNNETQITISTVRGENYDIQLQKK